MISLLLSPVVSGLTISANGQNSTSSSSGSANPPSNSTPASPANSTSTSEQEQGQNNNNSTDSQPQNSTSSSSENEAANSSGNGTSVTAENQPQNSTLASSSDPVSANQTVTQQTDQSATGSELVALYEERAACSDERGLKTRETRIVALPSSVSPSFVERGRDYEIRSNGDGAYSATFGLQEWYKDPDNGKYVPHKILQGESYVEVYSGQIAWKISKDCFVIVDPKSGEELADENWLISIDKERISLFEEDFVSQFVLENETGVYVTNSYSILNGSVAVNVTAAISDGGPTQRIIGISGLENSGVVSEVRIERFWKWVDTDAPFDKIQIYDDLAIAFSADLSKSDSADRPSILGRDVSNPYNSTVTFERSGKPMLSENLATAAEFYQGISYDRDEAIFSYESFNPTSYRDDNKTLFSIMLVDDTSIIASSGSEDGSISTNSATGSACPSTSYTKSGTDTTGASRIPASTTNSYCERVYIEWNITAIPDSASIKYATLMYDQSTLSGARNCAVNAMANRPSTTTNATTLWNDIGDGTNYISNDSFCTSTANKAVPLGSSAANDLSGRLGSNWFAIGIKISDETRDSSGHSSRFHLSEATSTYLDPTLQVFYTTNSNVDSQVFAAVYGTTASTSDAPRFRQWQTSSFAWSSEVVLPATGSNIRNAWVEYSPASVDTILAMSESDDGTLNLFKCTATCTTNSNWNLVSSDFADVGSPTGANMHAGMKFEQSSGDLLIVYDKWITEANDLYYRQYFSNGTLSSERGFNYAGGATSDSEQLGYFDLAANPNTDEITVLLNEEGARYAFVWDGNNVGNQLKLTGTSTGGYQKAAVAYEKTSSASLVIGSNGTDKLNYARWNGSSWSSIATTDQSAVSNGVTYLHAYTNPAASSNKVMVCALDGSLDIYCTEFNAGTVGTWQQVTTSANGYDTKQFEYLYNPVSGTGMIVWDDSTYTAPRLAYKTWNGTSFSAKTELGYANGDYWMVGTSSYNSGDLVNGLILSESSRGIGAFLWDGQGVFVFGSSYITNSISGFDLSNVAITAQPQPKAGQAISSPDPRLESSGEQRVSYFDGTTNWVFYYDGSGSILYKYSTDSGTSWSAATSAQTGTLAANSFFSVYGEGNATIISWANSTKVLTKKGIINGSSIAWSNPQAVFYVNGTSPGEWFYPSFEKVGSTLFLGFNVRSNSANVGKVYSSSSLGSSWSSSTDLYSGESNPAIVGIATYGYVKAVAVQARYGSSEFHYKTWNGSAWSSTTSTTSGAGLTSNALKTTSFSTTSDGACAWVGYVPSDSGGSLKSMKFCDGTVSFPSTSISGTNLYPTISSTLYTVNSELQPLTNDHIYMHYVRGSTIYEIETVLGAWSAERPPSGLSASIPAYLHAEKYTHATLARENFAWRDGASSPHTVNFVTENHGLITSSGVKNSPSSTEYFEGERRVLSNTNGTLFAFYYDDSNIMYRRSFDNGYTWTINSISTGTGNIASDNFRWSIATTKFSGTTRIALLYYQVSGSNTNFYQKTFNALDTGLVPISTVNTFSAANDASCSPTGVCAAAAGSSDSNSTLYAAYRWKSGGTWQYRILKSPDGGTTWSTSLTSTNITGTSNRVPITITFLNNSTKMLFAYATYESGNIFYRVFNGSSWGPLSNVTAGITQNSVKQISSDTVNMKFSNGTVTAYIVFLTNGNSGSMKVAKFSQSGGFLSLETADSTKVHSLPAISVAGDGVIYVYSIANGYVYETRRNAITWVAPIYTYAPTYAYPDHITAKISDSFTAGAMLSSGFSSPYNFLYSALGWNTYWVAAYHDREPHFSTKKVKMTCNFSGTTPSIIDDESKRNSLQCKEALTVFTTEQIFHGEDWSYRASAILTADGVISVRGEVYEGCEIHWPICNGFLSFGQEAIRYWSSDIPTSAGLNDNVTLYMEWNDSDIVTWYYQINSGSPIEFGHFKKWDEEQSNFVTGIIPLPSAWPTCPLFSSDCTAYYFQAGVGSLIRITDSGWSVKISNPSYANTTAQNYTNFEVAKVVQGDDAFWDNTFRNGGYEYTGVNADEYKCLNSSYPQGQVRFEYDGSSTVATRTKLWGSC